MEAIDAQYRRCFHLNDLCPLAQQHFYIRKDNSVYCCILKSKKSQLHPVECICYVCRD